MGLGDMAGKAKEKAGEHPDRWLPARAPHRRVIAVPNAARGSVSWVTIGAGLALRAGPSRRAAVHGVTAVSVASAASHLLGRVLVERARPDAAHLAARRAPAEAPTSSSFPSSHTSCAVAFATALALESPPLGGAVAPVTAVVAYARLRTRVHWPTDVLAGAALGAVTAVATRRVATRIRPGTGDVLAVGAGRRRRSGLACSPAPKSP